MIEVEVFYCDESSDLAEAETPEAALLAALTLSDEGPSVRGYDPEIVFRIGGTVVRRTTRNLLEGGTK